MLNTYQFSFPVNKFPHSSASNIITFSHTHSGREGRRRRGRERGKERERGREREREKGGRKGAQANCFRPLQENYGGSWCLVGLGL